ncbi:helix-turn-helix domain-containing protein [Pedobacter kyungheensis]|nr:helix-turn-helix domain-containing protein [Pedobacter kyungheensis]
MSRKQKYDYQFKLDLVNKVIKEEHSVHELSNMYGLAKSQLQFWCKLHEHHGEKGLEDIAVKSYTADEKLEIIRYYQASGLSLIDTCAIFMVASFSTLFQWVVKFEQIGYQGLVDKRGDHLKKKKTPKRMAKTKVVPGIKDSMTDLERLTIENEYLRAEVAYLKKLEALAQSKQVKKKKP